MVRTKSLVLAVAILMLLMLTACGGGRGVSRGLLPTLGTDLQQTGGEEAENGTGGQEGVSPPSDAPPWTGNEEGVWRDPNTGELIPIVEGFAKLEMKVAVSGDEELAFWETIEARGYVPVGAFLFLPPYDGRGIMHGVRLPPGITFAEAYENLMSEFGQLFSFLEPVRPDEVDYFSI